jgi:hypothetical protein
MPLRRLKNAPEKRNRHAQKKKTACNTAAPKWLGSLEREEI